jgi:formate-dependent nitrite reductase membrane component NrfD
MFLLADLGSPLNAWRVWMKPKTSWIARGTIIIVLFMIFAAIHMGWLVWPFGSSLADDASTRHLVGVLGAIFAFLTVIYTGLLLGYSQPIALWHTALLPVLFFFSAVSTGIMAIMVTAGNLGGVAAEQLAFLAKADAALLVLELFVLIVFLYNAYRTIESRYSAKRILSGPVAPVFWLGVIACGLVLPLFLELSGGHGTTAILAAVLGLFGGLCLRFTVLAGGMITQITAGGFEFARVARPKDPMPAMGKVPPS